MKLGEHDLPVRSDEAAPELRYTLFFSRTTDCTASATDDVGTSSSMSTPSRSNHWRAIDTARSGLFWWSALMTSTLSPLPATPKSSSACLAHTIEVGPPVFM